MAGEGVSRACGGAYDRLHLHTDRNHSACPGCDAPDYPAYPRGAGGLLPESYAPLEIKPVFNTKWRACGVMRAMACRYVT